MVWRQVIELQLKLVLMVVLITTLQQLLPEEVQVMQIGVYPELVQEQQQHLQHMMAMQLRLHLPLRHLLRVILQMDLVQ